MRTQAIILKKIPTREYDELIICYTKNAGKQIYHAKSVLRPTSKQGSHLDVLNWSDFSLVEGNGRPIITSACCLESFGNLKSSLPALVAAYFLLECFDKLVLEGESDPKLWEFLSSRLYRYNELAVNDEADWESVISSSRGALLETLGYGADSSIEELANSQFHSLQFARKVIR